MDEKQLKKAGVIAPQIEIIDRDLQTLRRLRWWRIEGRDAGRDPGIELQTDTEFLVAAIKTGLAARKKKLLAEAKAI